MFLRQNNLESPRPCWPGSACPCSCWSARTGQRRPAHRDGGPGIIPDGTPDRAPGRLPCAGLIFVRRDAVRGLTAAAAIGITAAIGAAASADEPKLLLFSRQGFTPELAAAARPRPDVALIDLKRLYQGS